MEKFYKDAVQKLETAISELEIDATCTMPRAEAAIQIQMLALTMN